MLSFWLKYAAISQIALIFFFVILALPYLRHWYGQQQSGRYPSYSMPKKESEAPAKDLPENSDYYTIVIKMSLLNYQGMYNGSIGSKRGPSTKSIAGTNQALARVTRER